MSSKSILIKAESQSFDRGLIAGVSAESAGWHYLNLEVRRLLEGDRFESDTGTNEAVIVSLGGRFSVKSSQGEFENLGRIPDVFGELPYAVYLATGTQFELLAQEDGVEIAYCFVPSDQKHQTRAIRPEDIVPEIRGGGSATRQINTIIPPGFDCHRLVTCEAYTPGGNWSSYPPHKHDTIIEENGRIIEAELEEIYFYKFRRPEGFALQRIYNDDRSLDEVAVPHNNDIVLVREGYHPVSAPYGYDCYYLNFLAGSHQSLACSDDPAYKWVKETWDSKDPRLPMVGAGQTEKNRVAASI